MANTKTAVKRDKQSKARRLRNRMAKSKLRTATRSYLETVNSQDASAAEEQLKHVISLIDKYSGKGVLHRNTAARKKSRLSAKLNALS